MIKYFIRTTNERTLDESFFQINFEKLIDKDKNTCKFYIECLKYISDYDAILLEDDLILCNNFEKEIEKAVSMYPNKIISFFSVPTLYFETRENKLHGFLQCYYFPKGIGKVIAEKLEKLNIKKFKKVVPMLRLLNLDIIEYRPCLVQHLDNDSLVGNRTGFRRTPYFIDFLKELNIDYKDAEQYKPKLEYLLNQQIKAKIKSQD